VPGARNGEELRFATSEEFAELADAGVDYFDAYPGDAPAWTLRQTHLSIMLAAYAGGTIDEMQKLEELGMELCEASIMPHEEYGRELSALDVARYSELCDALDSPIIVPSQKKLTPRDVSALRDCGARGVLIGAIVTGREADSIEAAARAFADVID
jgi:putative N-acetylmannosamine-6-phosphate epimerase